MRGLIPKPLTTGPHLSHASYNVTRVTFLERIERGPMHPPRTALLLLSLLTATAIAPRPVAASGLPPLTTLAPGTDLRIQQTVDVNIVLIGFGALIPNPAALTSLSPM